MIAPRQPLLAPTDSRFNPAQRHLEEGDIDAAETSKAALEGKQRSRNKARQEAGEAWVPKWFEPTDDGEWAFKQNDDYWHTRASKGAFEDLDLW